MLVKLQAFSLQLNEKLRSQAYFHEISFQKLSAFSAYFNSVTEHSKDSFQWLLPDSTFSLRLIGYKNICEILI